MKNCEFKTKQKCKLNDHNCNMDFCPLKKDPSKCGHARTFDGVYICDYDILPCAAVLQCPKVKLDNLHNDLEEVLND